MEMLKKFMFTIGETIKMDVKKTILILIYH